MTIANLQVIILFHKSFSCYLHFFWAKSSKNVYLQTLASPFMCQEIGIQTLWSYLDGIGKWDGSAGKTYWKTLLAFIFCYQTWHFDLTEKKIRQRERSHHVMTIQSSTFWRGDYCISSLTWASCVAYPFRWQPRPDDGMSRVRLPRLFLYPLRPGSI